MNILGISAYYHDSAAVIVSDGKILAAVQEERLTRKKHDASFPINAIKQCLTISKLSYDEIDSVIFYEKPFLKFKRLCSTYLGFSPLGFKSFRKAAPIWLGNKLFQKRNILKALTTLCPKTNWSDKLLFSEHHLSHAASAFFPSPFEEAVILTMDGVGEWATASLAIGRGDCIDILKEIHFPHSLGLLYSAFTYYSGFKVNSGEYKLMGLAPYGMPKYVDIIRRHLIDVKEDGSFRLDLSYFNYCSGLTMINKRFERLFGQPARNSSEPVSQFFMDIAASIQAVVEEVVLKIVRNISEETKIKNLCLAGGVALNCVMNGKIIKIGLFENVWVQPASGDSGGALGAALAATYMYHRIPRKIDSDRDAMQGALLGPAFSQTQIEQDLREVGAYFKNLDDDVLIDRTASLLSEGNVVGWFQGRMEYGPRALGGRSILADPRSVEMQKSLNLKIKYRESFRPFAPSILREHVSEWFELNCESPYMLLVANVSEKHRKKTDASEAMGLDKLREVRSDIPAVTHVDYSARVQTVDKQVNPRYHALISSFSEISNCPILVNTSFNVRGEPIVCTPQDAFKCFMGTEMDVLVVGNCIMSKSEQDSALRLDYKNHFALD